MNTSRSFRDFSSFHRKSVSRESIGRGAVSPLQFGEIETDAIRKGLRCRRVLGRLFTPHVKQRPVPFVDNPPTLKMVSTRSAPSNSQTKKEPKSCLRLGKSLPIKRINRVNLGINSVQSVKLNCTYDVNNAIVATHLVPPSSQPFKLA